MARSCHDYFLIPHSYVFARSCKILLDLAKMFNLGYSWSGFDVTLNQTGRRFWTPGTL
jgi:hypothetical protein